MLHCAVTFEQFIGTASRKISNAQAASVSRWRKSATVSSTAVTDRTNSTVRSVSTSPPVDSTNSAAQTDADVLRRAANATTGPIVPTAQTNPIAVSNLK